MRLRVLVPASALAFAALGERAAEPPAPLAAFVRESYTKYEHLVPMRDGTRLLTAVYVPKDAGPAKRYPILLNRTPYSVAPYGVDAYPASLGPSEAAAREKFVFAYQDVRGRMMSEGTFVDARPVLPKKGPKDVDETTDAFDTVDWLVKNVPHNNGKVGTWGISYPGFYAALAAIDAHPALVAVSPQAPVADWFAGDDFHHNGALFLAAAFNFYVRFGQPRERPTTKWAPRFDHGTMDGYRFFLEAGPIANLSRHMKGVAFWDDLMAHETYDAYWQARNTRPHLAAIRPAVLTVGGWYDAEDVFGSLETYGAIERQSPGASNRLVVGPWWHGGWARSEGESHGRVTFGQKTSVRYREEIELPFFLHYLKGAPDPRLPEATVFETGRNVWRSFDAWPPREAKATAFRLGAGGILSADAPPSGSAVAAEWVSDPAKPVPYVESVEIGMDADYMTADQRFASRRPDVAVWQTPSLETDLTVAGPIEVSLSVSTSGTDADWVVKLIDVWPDDVPVEAWEWTPRNAWDEKPTRSKLGGNQQLVRGEPFRGRFRKSLSSPEPFTPEKVETVAFRMPDVLHTFRRGHRVMVQVQSSWFPLVDRNPQTFVPIRTAKESDFRPATMRVHDGAESPSHVVLRVLPAERP
ncbi:Cocaine esterase [Planctomycetaceae bacterium]|nr:Cocaine esterase [Planctomycetaceae bacterium]